VPGHDREARRAEADHRRPGQLFEHDLGAANGISERDWCLFRHPGVIPPVRRDLVPGRGDAMHQRRLAVRQPAEHEERRPRLKTREQLEQPGHAAAHP